VPSMGIICSYVRRDISLLDGDAICIIADFMVFGPFYSSC
jgi:hypothetical protein